MPNWSYQSLKLGKVEISAKYGGMGGATVVSLSPLVGFFCLIKLQLDFGRRRLSPNENATVPPQGTRYCVREGSPRTQLLSRRSE